MSMAIAENIQQLKLEIAGRATLVAVSKMHPAEAVLEAYQAGQLDFGENRVQEILAKQPHLPSDIRWHLIGHLQTNKVKQVVPVVKMIHSVDSEKLLAEISQQSVRYDITMDCLLQVFIATEETKFGFDRKELLELLTHLKLNPLPGIRIRGLMGMASFTDNLQQVRNEFRGLKSLFEQVRKDFFDSDESFNELSMGMSGDFGIAIEEGSTMVRVGTRIFGSR
jgi:pyridoxal phosphate enzyme (YggS family)